MYDLAPSWTEKFAITTEDTALKFRFNLYFKIKPYLGLELWTALTNLLERPCRSKGKRKLRWETRCKSETNIKTVINKWLGLYSHWRDQMILIVFKCRNSSLDHYDTVKKFIERMMEQSIMTMLLMNVRKGNSTKLNIGQWKNSYHFWQEVEEKKKGSNIARFGSIVINSFEQFKHIQEVLSILHCKTMYCYQKVLPSTFITSETHKNWCQ